MPDGPTSFAPEPAIGGDEPSTFLGSLERQRRIFAWKVSDLSADELNRGVCSSELTLAKLLKHLAHMEDINFTEAFAGHQLPEPWATWDREAEPNWLWDSAASDTPEYLWGLWRDAVERSRAVADSTLANGDLATTGDYLMDGQHVSLRRFIADMIEEYARHVGHADLIRESIDGQTGEDPPETGRRARPRTLPCCARSSLARTSCRKG